MQIVIDIAQNEYDALEKLDAKYLLHIIKDGTPLPKGHGRIVDIDNAVKDLESVNESFCTFYAKGYGARVDYIGEVLIEADKEVHNADSN